MVARKVRLCGKVARRLYGKVGGKLRGGYGRDIGKFTGSVAARDGYGLGTGRLRRRLQKLQGRRGCGEGCRMEGVTEKVAEGYGKV